MLRLPEGITACLFDLDGVVTQTAKVHAAAWKQMFDEFLRERAERTGEPVVAFDPKDDYDRYVDGRPRLDGVRTFLDARGIQHDAQLDRELGDRKNELVLRLIREQGVEVYESSIWFVELAREQGLRRAVVSSSANTREVLTSVGIDQLFEAGRAGDFGWVVGVDRTGQADALAEHGADVVVRDLSELIDG
jgi:beta-phosphoglucomutase-like phosphatase (HAD superfamily)